MASWSVIAERVLRSLAGGDIPDDFPTEPEEVIAAATQLIPFLTKKDFYEAYAIGEKALDGMYYITFSGVTVYRDNGKYPYAVMPAKPNIIHGRGKPQVFYTGTREVNFLYSEASLIGVIRGSDFSKLTCDTRFWIENMSDGETGTNSLRVFFEDSLDGCVQKVAIRMVPAPEFPCISPDAEVPIPAHLEEELVRELYKWFNPMDKETQDMRRDGVNQN